MGIRRRQQLCAGRCAANRVDQVLVSFAALRNHCGLRTFETSTRPERRLYMGSSGSVLLYNFGLAGGEATSLQVIVHGWAPPSARPAQDHLHFIEFRIMFAKACRV